MYVSPASGGHVIRDGVKLASYPSYYPYKPDENVTLVAVPAIGYRFDNWSGGISSSERSISIITDDDKVITANFSRIVPNWLVAIIVVVITTALLLRWQRRRLKQLPD